jgi:hypothetical protein
MGFLGHAELRQREMGVGGVGAQRVQRLQPLAPVVRAARGFAVDGDEVVPTRPHRLDPVVETPCKGERIDAIDQRTQPPFARDPMMERREHAQKIEMMLTPVDDVVEIVARGDGGAGQQKQNLG